MTKDNVIVGPWENSSLAAPELSEEEHKEREVLVISSFKLEGDMFLDLLIV